MQDELFETAELYEHHRIVADKGQGLLRLDKFLFNRLEQVSRNKIQVAVRAGNVLVNEHVVKPNYRVKPEDVITVVLPYPHREYELVPEDIPLDILYEDDHLLVVNKAAGMVVHPGHGNFTGTLVNALAWHLARPAAVPDRRDAARAGAPDRQGHLGPPGDREDRDGAEPAGEAVFRPHHEPHIPGRGMGHLRQAGGHHHREYRQEHTRPAEDAGLPGGRPGQTGHHALQGAGKAGLREPGGVQARDRTHAPDQGAHGVCPPPGF